MKLKMLPLKKWKQWIKVTKLGSGFINFVGTLEMKKKFFKYSFLD